MDTESILSHNLNQFDKIQFQYKTQNRLRTNNILIFMVVPMFLKNMIKQQFGKTCEIKKNIG